ncbi:MAG: Gx transporter family protein [Lachnospiraceae bacterium]
MTQNKEPLNQKLARMGLFTALGAIFGYIESLLPVFAGIPGVKLGLANLSVLYILMRYSLKEATLVSGIAHSDRRHAVRKRLRDLLQPLWSRTQPLCMNAAKAHTDTSTRMISVLGGISHNIGQLLLAMWLVGRTTLLYTPVLLLSDF